MADFSTDIAIIGAGVVGLAIGRSLSKQGREVVILENYSEFGKITSSRNSGVIHAGIYYPSNSLKAKMCVEGNKLLYEYCKKYSIPFRNSKKILVACNDEQIKIIDSIKLQAEKNGVKDIKKLSNYKVSELEPLIKCKEGILISSSGIIDSYQFMNSLEGEIKDYKGMIAYNANVNKINYNGKNFTLNVFDQNKNTITIDSKYLINSAGLFATEVTKKIEEFDKDLIPKIFYAKGNYFSISKDLGIRHLIYPIPEGFGLGIHLTLELDNTV
jgi:Predicted dehydrogenase